MSSAAPDPAWQKADALTLNSWLRGTAFIQFTADEMVQRLCVCQLPCVGDMVGAVSHGIGVRIWFIF